MYINCKTMRAVSMGNPDITSRYFKDIRRLEQMSAEDQTALLTEYANCDNKRKNEIMQALLLANQNYIVSMARYLTDGDDFNDLISEGNLGMIQAIKKFDARKENKFLTYAAYYVQKYMNNYINNIKRIVKTKNVARVYAYSEKAKNTFFLINGRYPSIDELKIYLSENGVVFSKDEDLYDINVNSIDMPFGDDCPDSDADSASWLDRHCYARADEEDAMSNVAEQIEKMSINKMVELSLSYLTEEEKELVCEYYGIGCNKLTNYEIARKHGFNCDENDIEKKIKKCIKKIKKHGKIETDIHR